MAFPKDSEKNASDAHASSLTHPDPVPDMGMGGMYANAAEQGPGNRAARRLVADRLTDGGAQPAAGDIIAR